MFNKKFTIFLLLILTCSPFLWNCSGDETSDNTEPNDCNMETPTISSNTPVTAGTYIMLETPHYSTMAEYHWTGPNGFTSSEQNPMVMASDLSAGTYSLYVNEYACVSETATVTIAVTTPTAPCSPTNNTATNSVYPTMTFSSVMASVVQDSYQIEANGSNGDLTIIFASDATPTAGMYSICPDCPTSFMEDNEVCVSIVTGGTFSDYFRANTGNVYISYVNGHMSATFCNLAFSGTGVGTNFTSSAKITDL